MNETFCFHLRVFSVSMSDEVRRLIVMAVAAAATASLR